MNRLFQVVLLLSLLVWCAPSHASIATVQAKSAAANNVTFTSTATAGNIIVICGHRDGSTTAPSLPGGYTAIANSGANTNSMRIAYKVSDGTETSVTMTNATSIGMEELSGQQKSSPIGGNAAGGAASATLAYNTLTMSRTDGTSWIIGCGGHRSATNVNSAPTGMTLRTGAGTTDFAISDTNAGVSSWSTQTVGVNANSGWRTYTVEILANQCLNTSFGGGWTCIQSANGERASDPTTTATATFAAGVGSGTSVLAVVKYCQDASCNTAPSATASLSGDAIDEANCELSSGFPFDGTTTNHKTRIYVWVCPSTASGTQVVLTNGSAYYGSVDVAEWSGGATSSFFSGAAGTAQSQASPSSASITVTNSTDLMMCYADFDGGTSSALAPSSGMTIYFNAYPDGNSQVGEAKTGVSGSQSGGYSWTGTALTHVSVCTAMAAASGGGGATTQPYRLMMGVGK